MPEGPEIRRAADRLAAALAGQTAERLFFAFDRLKAFERLLSGREILSVSARGKAMLTRFAGDYTLYSHNQLYGRWTVCEEGPYPESSRQLRAAIHAGGRMALLYSASAIEVLSAAELARHPYVSTLGPELLDPEVTLAQVISVLEQPEVRRRCLMGLLQDQRRLAGMGNYLCCEALFDAGIHPCTRPADLDRAALRRLAQSCLRLTRQSYQSGGITNETGRAEMLRQQGVSFEGRRFLVYRRGGESCYRCGGAIVKGRFCGRMGYLCPHCQPR
ncbi:MAG TPA: endonuclease VIII [Gammaproteobacteria bacterium]|nr:endonuclease VIII [Gammaproteobacteria bacterium]